MKKRNRYNLIKVLFPIIIICTLFLLKSNLMTNYSDDSNKFIDVKNSNNYNSELADKKYNGKAYVSIKLKPKFNLTTSRYKFYSKLDSLGRCGVAEACVSRRDMPKNKKRGSIGMVKPSGWHTIRYSNVDGKYLYNRCHLLAWSITGTMKDNRNLITGTRYMNIEGMCEQEEKIREYLSSENNHVMYRVTPIFKGRELVARGVHIEARSVEDDKLIINDYAFNVQPGIDIDYKTGFSQKSE